ncbi:MAG: HAD family hydrolase, partial [Promethearchaeota archaeon]
SDQRISHFFQFLQAQEIFIPFERFKDAFDTKFHFSEVSFEDINYRHICTENRILRVLKQINVEIHQTELDKLKQEFESLMLQDPPKIKKGVESTLDVLAPDYKIGLISNTGVTPGPIISEVLERLNILQYFDETIYSDETGYFKPHPKMFEIPLGKFDCEPQNAIHIGDMLETDVRGDKEFNMIAVWFNDSNKPESTEIQPDYEIKYISEVLSIVNNL